MNGVLVQMLVLMLVLGLVLSAERLGLEPSSLEESLFACLSVPHSVSVPTWVVPAETQASQHRTH